MRAVWLGVPEEFLDQRRRLGHDKYDELWDGVLHMVPPPTFLHDRLVNDLGDVLRRIGARRGLRKCTAGLFDPANELEYRVPDLSLATPEQESERGLVGAELVVEVLSPNDESRDKLGFYARVGVKEIWLIAPKTRVIEIYALGSSGYDRVEPLVSRVLGVVFETIAGPVLRLRDGGDTYDV